MARTITYVNSLGAELVLTNSAPFLLEDFSETENVNIYSSTSMNQDGNSYLSNTLDVRDISLDICLIATSNEELISYKNKVNKIFNPKIGEGYLIYTDSVKTRKVKCIVNKIPFFTDINGIASEGLISLTANNPYWTDLSESKEEIALWIGGFEFPLELIDGGIEMGYRSPSLIVNVINGGDVECGMRIEFTASATLTNPSLLNVNNGEFIKINKTMVAGETISIVTYFGSKKVESILGGVTTNAFNYIDFQSTFLQLDVGDNLYRYNADSGIDNLEVSIYYQPQYLGV